MRIRNSKTDVANHDTRISLKSPFIVRLNVVDYDKLTFNFDNPFDDNISKIMNIVSTNIMSKLPTSKFSYIQGNEISLLFYPNVVDIIKSFNKLNIFIASNASAFGTQLWGAAFKLDNLILFDCVSFNIPEKSIIDYFSYQQSMNIKNFTKTYENSYLKDQLSKYDNDDAIKTRMEQIGIAMEQSKSSVRLGSCIYRGASGELIIDKEIPEFNINSKYIADKI